MSQVSFHIKFKFKKNLKLFNLLHFFFFFVSTKDRQCRVFNFSVFFLKFSFTLFYFFHIIIFIHVKSGLHFYRTIFIAVDEPGEEIMRIFSEKDGAAFAQTVETSVLDWWARVRGSSGENCHVRYWHLVHVKIRRGWNVLQVQIRIIPLRVPKRGSHPLRCGSKLRWYVSG